MDQEKRKSNIPTFATFNAVYTAGFFIPDPSLVTAMCLLFDNIWLPNNIGLVMELVKKYRVDYKNDKSLLSVVENAFKDKNFTLKRINLNIEDIEDTFISLTPRQRKSIENYLLAAQDFCLRYHPLLKEKVLCTDLYPTGDVLGGLNFSILESKKQEKSNRFEAKVVLKGLVDVSGEDATEKFDKLVSRGAVPLLSTNFPTVEENKSSLNVKSLLSLIAMKSVELTLPQTKPAHPEIILEAREKLSDLLPPYWSAMLKLTRDFKTGLEQGQSLGDIERECEDYIDLNVRPALIELNSKLEKDRKSWFYKILSSFVTQMKVLVGKPPMTKAGLLASGLQLGANVALDVIPTDFSSQEPGLTFLIELDKLLRKEGKVN